MKKKILITMAAAVLSVSAAFPAFAAWHENGYGWWYDNGDGTYPVSCWQWVDGNQDGTAECYCFNSEGYIYTDTVTPDGYTVNRDGAWTENGVVQTKSVTPPQTMSDQSALGLYRNEETGETAEVFLNGDGSYRLRAECNGYVIDHESLVYVGGTTYTDRWGFVCNIESGTLSFVADGWHIYKKETEG